MLFALLIILLFYHVYPQFLHLNDLLIFLLNKPNIATDITLLQSPIFFIFVDEHVGHFSLRFIAMMFFEIELRVKNIFGNSFYY